MDQARQNSKNELGGGWREPSGGATPAKPTTRADTGYPIGAVSRLTRIQPSTLRMWERRYGLVDPGRSEGGNRRYNDHHIQRLVLVKSLVDAGHQIGTVAPMTIEDLQARLEAISIQALKPFNGVASRCRVVLLGSALPERLEADCVRTRELDVAASFRDEADLVRSGASLGAQVLIVKYATVHADALGKVRRLLAACGARQAVVVYGFGSSQALADLASSGAVCLRAPADTADLVRSCLRLGAPTSAPRPASGGVSGRAVPLPRFTPEQLARISALAPTIACECPHHLVDLISSMAAFEAYSRECENRSAEDAEIHAMLNATAGRSRAMLEAALQRVAEFEGIELS